ncbi:hypothetical protein HK405_008493 [Cladochytrium tenue]|nr:hypothetical protein HK405_008493 [Cladochytrium tenue]
MAPSFAVIGAGPAGTAVAFGLRHIGYDVHVYDCVDYPNENAVITATGTDDGPITANSASTAAAIATNNINATDAADAADTAAAQAAVEVVEFGETQGGGVSMFWNGFQALRGLGLYDEVIASPHQKLADIQFMKIDGTDPVRHYVMNSKTAADSSMYLRFNIHKPLLNACARAGVRIHLAKKLTGLTQTADAVTVEFADGTSRTFDFVVGADGMHSATRKALFPEAARPKIWSTGYIGVFHRGEQADGGTIELDYDMGLYSDAVTGNFLFTNNCSDTVASWMVGEFDTIHDVPVDAENSWRPYSELPQESERLAATVVRWGVPAHVVNSVKHARRITPAAIFDLPDLSALARGRVVLVGDAAHGTVPTIGQGLNCAFEDAATLVDLFYELGGAEKYAAVFELYGRVRIPRMRTVCKTARDVAASLKQGSAAKARFGRFMMRLVFSVFSHFGVSDATVGYDYKKDVMTAVAKYRATHK